MTATRVLGILVDIPEPHATVLREWRERVGDPLARQVPPHVTLLPPTPVPADSVDKIDAHLEQACTVTGEFAMHLAGTGTFRPVSQVVFVQVATGIGECEVLASAIRTGPLYQELEYPYHPHVTIAQDVDPIALDTAYDALSNFTARFTVADFTMYEQRDGGWDPIRRFPLGGR